MPAFIEIGGAHDKRIGVAMPRADVRVSMRSKGRRTRSPNRWTCASAPDRLPPQSIERHDTSAHRHACPCVRSTRIFRVHPAQQQLRERAVRRATRVAFTASCVSCQHSLKAVGSMASASAWPCRAPDVRVSMRSKGRRTRSPNRWTCASAPDRLPAQSIERLDARAQARAPLRALNADLSRPPSSAATARTPNSPPAPANAPRARSPDAGSHAAPAARSTTCRYAGACGPPRPT
ncbi:Uncharacterised protein [Burkholderia pseudomallei]|nr:Uncharacterised protein [Burkholderia pseudomallei]